MSRATHPLKRSAVTAADDEFYEKHANDPRFVDEDGNRIPIDPGDPTQRDCCAEWIQSYKDHGGEVTDADRPNGVVAAPVISCPALPSSPKPPSPSAAVGRLLVTVVDTDGSAIPGATVTADSLTKKTDSNGVADFGRVAPKTYTISAEKQGYGRWGPFADSVVVQAGDTAMGEQGLMRCIAYRLNGNPRMIADAHEILLMPTKMVPLPGSVNPTLALPFGQDTFFGTGGVLPTGAIEVGSDEATLKQKMSRLVDLFARDDTSGMTRREFNEFQTRHHSLDIYTDPNLDSAVKDSANFVRIRSAPSMHRA